MHANGKDDGTSGFDGGAKPAEADKHVHRPNETDLKLDGSAQLLIGQHLKAVYGAIVRQPIPDQFLQLLDELERKERDR